VTGRKRKQDMAKRFINQLVDGEALEDVFLLTDKQLRANRNAALYLLVELRDKTGAIQSRMWNVTEESTGHVKPGDYVRVRGKVQTYLGGLQMIITHITPLPVESVNVDDFVRSSGIDGEKLRRRLTEILEGLANADARALMAAFLADDALMAMFCKVPAGTKAHHAYRGGLLEHVVNMLEAALRIVDLYPSVDRDTLCCGIFLHDLGKTRELAEEAGAPYTDEGQLIGHITIAVEMLNEKLAAAEAILGRPVSRELILRLKHMIVSHHGQYEFGSPKLPMTPEAVALHHLDNLDAKIHEFNRDIMDDPNPQSNWTQFNPRLDRKLFKGLKSPT
jgi:3'-5' exoribonuclease